MIEKNADSIINLLNKVSEIEIEDGENEEENSKLSIGEINKIEDEINKLLTECLPALYGDEIIQIGTTVHKYGCSDIIYKNIISLNTCDKIEDSDVIECKTGLTQKAFYEAAVYKLAALKKDFGLFVNSNIVTMTNVKDQVWKDRAAFFNIKLLDNLSQSEGKKYINTFIKEMKK